MPERTLRFQKDFQREARALARLTHPNIVMVFEFGQVADMFYFVMEYIDGVNLREAIEAGGLSTHEALKVIPQICEALQFAHDEGIVSPRHQTGKHHAGFEGAS